jgi:hypothetical protein
LAEKINYPFTQQLNMTQWRERERENQLCRLFCLEFQTQWSWFRVPQSGPKKPPQKKQGTQMYQPNPLHPERENSKIFNLVFSITIIIIINF